MTRKDMARLFLRFLVIFAMCCPVFIAIGIGLGDNNNGVLETTIYIVLGGLAVAIEEYFFWKTWKKRMIAKQNTTPEKYFAEQKRKMLEKRNVKEQTQKVENTKKTQKGNVKKIDVEKGRKNGK